MDTYFVVVWEDSPNKKVEYIERCISETQMFDFIKNKREKSISVYKANCILDWS